MSAVSTIVDSTVSEYPDSAGLEQRRLTPRVGPVEGMRQTFSLAWRTLVQIRRNPFELIDFSVQPVMFLLLFTYVFGGAIGGSPKAYLMFALPGIIVQNSLFTTLNTATGLSTDLEKGFFDRLRSLPIARFAPLSGRILADLAKQTWAVAMLLGVGYILGFRIGTNPLGVLAATALVLVSTLAISWALVLVSMLAANPEKVQIFGFGQPGQGLGDHRRVGRDPGGRQRLGVPGAGRVQVAFGAGQVAEPGGGHRVDLPGQIQRDSHLYRPGQGLARGLGTAVQAGQVAGGVDGVGPELGQAEPLGVGQRPGQLVPGRLPLARQPQLPHHEQAELHLVLGAAERRGEFAGLTVMADRGGVLTAPPFHHGQAAERHRLAPALPQLGQDARAGQEIRFRLGVPLTEVECPVPAQDPGDRGHPWMRVTDGVVEDVRADRARPTSGHRVGLAEQGGERAEQRHDRVTGSVIRAARRPVADRDRAADRGVQVVLVRGQLRQPVKLLGTE